MFDGPEDRNGTRNFDEIGFWADYIRPGAVRATSTTTTAARAACVPARGSSSPATRTPTRSTATRSPARSSSCSITHGSTTAATPSSDGAVEAAALQGGANLTHRSDPQFDTADFADTAPGNLRADYVLPSKHLRIVDSAVFWPRQGEPGSELTGVFPFPSSDHRLVWVDVRI